MKETERNRCEEAKREMGSLVKRRTASDKEFIRKVKDLLHLLEKYEILAFCDGNSLYKFNPFSLHTSLYDVLTAIELALAAIGVKDWIVVKKPRRPIMVNIKLPDGSIKTVALHIGYGLVNKKILSSAGRLTPDSIIPWDSICECMVKFD